MSITDSAPLGDDEQNLLAQVRVLSSPDAGLEVYAALVRRLFPWRSCAKPSWISVGSAWSGVA